MPALHAKCLKTIAWEGGIASPSKNLGRTLAGQTRGDLPITCPGVTGEVKSPSYYLLLPKAW